MNRRPSSRPGRWASADAFRAGLVLLALGAGAAAIGCVGDAASTVNDAGGMDGGGQDSGGQDVAVTDGGSDGSDALVAPCDLSKPFGTPLQVQGILQGANVSLSANYLNAYFAVYYTDAGVLYDLYTATRSDLQSPFLNISNLTVLNSAADDTEPSVTGDGLTIFFESSRSGNFDLYSASRGSAASAFTTAPIALTALNTAVSEADPFVREDGQVLYYRSGGDIFRATLGGGGFANPVAVVAINTAGLEANPVVTPDELTIFFASDRSDGSAKGGTDIWTAKRANTSVSFGAPANVQELNTSASESPQFVTRDGCTIYLDRIGSAPLVATRPK